ncbi:hypothetical protein B0T25DRAFT_453411 [Lasiosphaeria hispida]|uniref:RBR-type E3 ubiquitin transferase n=1 Tax=Lasiosphaeria hispida TaxID=260671 RepID=A0AAJ0MD83_9PEZI|nr:hypothetical protein B0T25DRAFT_453411 [Lasiosphaeria hispida]
MKVITEEWPFAPLESAECIVCLETKKPSEFPSSPLTNDCEHSPAACLECVKFAISSDLKTKLWSEVACPECDSILSFEAVQQYADEATRLRHAELSVRQALQLDDEFIWCSSGCGDGQIHDGGFDQPIVKCGSCGQLTCFQHKVAWHVGVTCGEWDLLKENPAPRQPTRGNQTQQMREMQEMRASEEAIKMIAKSCPSCARNIEKNGGW